jgi:hypothetical protein
LLDVTKHGLVLFLFGQLSQAREILGLAVQAVPGLNPVLQGFDLLLDFLRLGGVVPEFRIGGGALEKR